MTVYTNHQILQYFLTTNVCNPRQMRWAQSLTNFNFTIVYHPGSRVGKPDALSRLPEYPPEGGSYASRTDDFETGVFQSFALLQQGLNSGQPSGRKKGNTKAAQNKKTPTKCDSSDKRFQDGSRTGHLRLKGWHHTSPKTDVSGDGVCYRPAQQNIWQAGSKKRHGKQTLNCSGPQGNRCGLHLRSKSNLTEP